MSQRNFTQMMRKICRVASHVGVFEGSFPKILVGTREYTRSNLVVLRDCLPDLKHMIKYAADTVPVVGRMLGLVDQGASDLAQASTTLRQIRKSTEQAVSEIFGVLDKVDPLLSKAAKAEGGSEETRKALAEARGQLTLVLNALQFQDITSQQIEATNSLLANMGKGLAALADGLGEKIEGMPEIKVKEGTFDPNASFDRGRADVDQAEIDNLVAGGVPGPSAQKQPAASSKHSSEDLVVEGGEASLGQDDIEALLSSNKAQGQAAGSNGGTPDAVSQDDIDALLKG